MPELPEVETVRRTLAPLVHGRRVVDAAVLDARLVAPHDTASVASAVTGAVVGAPARRGKYLLLPLARDGDDVATLLVHLRMTGNLLHRPARTDGVDQDVDRHTRAVLRLDDGARLDFVDVRRFGTWVLLGDVDLAGHLDVRLGPEPLGDDFGPAVLRRALAGRRAPVKALLLDQRVVAGVGNIYADEALHRARVHPCTPGAAVSAAAAGRLAHAVRHVLAVGIDAQGASIRDYRTPGGGHGSMQERFAVFGRTGEPCPTCGREVVKLRVAGRGTHVCPSCQRLRRPGVRAGRGMRASARAFSSL
jgi:formamidopyrimidine-DNA glycosylase